MQKTPNFHLNQWALNDRIQMSDFNADNLAVDAALAGLSGQIAGLPSAGDLENAKQELESSMLQFTPVYDLTPTYSQGSFFLNINGLDLQDYAAIRLTISIFNGSTQVYHLKPRYKAGANQATMITSYGTSPVSGAMAVLLQSMTTTLLLFPLGNVGSGGVLGGVFFGNTAVGAGSAGTMLSNLSGFEIAAASGTADSSARVTVKLSGIK